MVPSIGRIVHYTLSEQDVELINEKRAKSSVQANRVNAADVVPAIIVRTWGNTPMAAVQLHVFLDGEDTVWLTSRTGGEGPGQWFPPPCVKQA